jgi:hypothetical protein
MAFLPAFSELVVAVSAVVVAAAAVALPHL